MASDDRILSLICAGLATAIGYRWLKACFRPAESRHAVGRLQQGVQRSALLQQQQSVAQQDGHQHLSVPQQDGHQHLSVPQQDGHQLLSVPQQDGHQQQSMHQYCSTSQGRLPKKTGSDFRQPMDPMDAFRRVLKERFGGKDQTNCKTLQEILNEIRTFMKFNHNNPKSFETRYQFTGACELSTRDIVDWLPKFFPGVFSIQIARGMLWTPPDSSQLVPIHQQHLHETTDIVISSWSLHNDVFWVKETDIQPTIKATGFAHTIACITTQDGLVLYDWGLEQFMKPLPPVRFLLRRFEKVT